MVMVYYMYTWVFIHHLHIFVSFLLFYTVVLSSMNESRLPISFERHLYELTVLSRPRRPYPCPRLRGHVGPRCLVSTSRTDEPWFRTRRHIGYTLGPVYCLAETAQISSYYYRRRSIPAIYFINRTYSLSLRTVRSSWDSYKRE